MDGDSYFVSWDPELTKFFNRSTFMSPDDNHPFDLGEATDTPRDDKIESFVRWYFEKDNVG